MEKKAFTLAEILITLTVLGILAVIVVPNIFQHYKKAYTIYRLKQAYSMFYEAVRRAELESGTDSDNWDYTKINDISDFMSSQFEIIHDCRKSSDRKKGRCIGTFAKELIGKNVYNYNGGAKLNITESSNNYTYINCGNNKYQNVYFLNNMSMILKNGMSVGIANNAAYKYTQLIIDIDGPNKGANELNKDIFYLYFTGAESDTIDKNPRFHPYTVNWHIKEIDYNKARNYCINYSINSGGWTCFAYIMMSGWKIPNDYPVKF